MSHLTFTPKNTTSLEYDATTVTIIPPENLSFLTDCSASQSCPVKVNKLCLDSSDIDVKEDGVTLTVLPADDETSTSTDSVKIEIAKSAFCVSNSTRVPTSPLTYLTTRPPPPSSSISNGNTTETPNQIPIYGIGVYVTDISSISLKTSNFYADLRIYILKYYRPYDSSTKADVLSAALDPDDPQKCNYMDGEKW